MTTPAAPVRCCGLAPPPLAALAPDLRGLSMWNGASGPAEPAFVSRHAKLPEGELEAWLKANNLAVHNPGGEWIRVRECPFCHPTRGKMDNMFKLNLSVSNGAYNCFRCQSSGSWSNFKHRLQTLRKDGVDIGADGGGAVRKAPPPAPALPEPRPDEQVQWERRLGESAAATDYLVAARGLRIDIAKKYGVGVTHFNFPEAKSDGEGGVAKEWKPHECLTFPMYTTENKVARQKIRGIEDKRNMRLYPTGGGWGLFGLNTIPADATEVVLTEGEFDAMAVHQATGKPAVSLPNGANSLPPAVLPLLERFEKVYLWMDDDAAGHANREKFARKLGPGRTVLVRSMGAELEGGANCVAKDANDALKQRLDLSAMLHAAEKVPHDQILSLNRLREDVLGYLRDPDARAGTQYSTMPGLNSILKGHRRGEFSILTGPTGVGKTTLLMQLSLDLARSNVRTLWGSFEISNPRLASQMFRHYMGGEQALAALKSGASVDHEAFNIAFEDFQREIPVSMMAFHGSTQLSQVLEVMDHAVYSDDVTHIILDNLQFMLSGQANGIGRFELQEETVAALRSFVTEHNCHLTLVVHPRKEDDDAPLTTASIYGAAKVTQEADNVMILQNEFHGKPKYLEIRKNRFSGDLGVIPLGFDKDKLSFVDLSGATPKAPSETMEAEAEAATDADLQLARQVHPPVAAEEHAERAPPAAAGGQQVTEPAVAATPELEESNGLSEAEQATKKAEASTTIPQSLFELRATEQPRHLKLHTGKKAD